jgi:hypothetical protein
MVYYWLMFIFEQMHIRSKNNISLFFSLTFIQWWSFWENNEISSPSFFSYCVLLSRICKRSLLYFHWCFVVYYIYIYNQTDISIWFSIRMNKMTFMDKPLPFSIDDILKYEKSKSTIYPSIIPRSYPLPSLLSSTYLSFSTAHKHSCSGNWFQRNEIVKIFFPCRTSINTM